MVDQTWTKTGPNEWTLTTGDPRSPGTGAVTGTSDGATVTITFDSNGRPATINPSPAQTAFTFNNGASASTVSLDLGTIGQADGLTQYDSGLTDPTIAVTSILGDGVAAGSLTGVSISDEGVVSATFTNGLTRTIFQIPLATFANENGLAQVSGTTFRASSTSGAATLNLSGVGAAGSIVASALEGSTTDTATEFNNMIVAQQAYSAASQVVASVTDMFDTLISVVR